jgi:hypothetical protein
MTTSGFTSCTGRFLAAIPEAKARVGRGVGRQRPLPGTQRRRLGAGLACAVGGSMRHDSGAGEGTALPR